MKEEVESRKDKESLSFVWPSDEAEEQQYRRFPEHGINKKWSFARPSGEATRKEERETNKQVKGLREGFEQVKDSIN